MFVCTLCVFMASGLNSYAQQGGAANAGPTPLQSGTNAYNTLNKDLPTANSNSSVVQDTMKNTGAGQSAEDALTNAAQSAATNAGKSAAAPTR
jgi:hypothetical protein